ncbi:MAG: hypothetical protein AAB787_00740 [Patescibacteria group bacterium]
MKSETRNCQNCQKDFTIEPDDFTFYEKIQVPPPTWCPKCRIIRRMSWRNSWHLYKRPEALSGEIIFSAFPPESPVKIYDRDYWWSDAWDPTEYAKDIDWSKPFFDQLKELTKEVPFAAHSTVSNINCDYCTNASWIKNCYFTRAASHTEDSAYLIWDNGSKSCLDSHMTEKCELSYGNVNAIRCYKTVSSVNCEDCQNIILSKDCVGCSNCVGCIGLRNKNYHIFNIPYSKEDYEKKIQELSLGSWQSYQNLRKQTTEFWLKFPVKYLQGVQNSNVSGDYIYNSKNVQHSYRVSNTEDSKYCMNLLDGPIKDCYDYANWGAGSELIYDSLVCGNQTYNLKFCWNCHTSTKNTEYSLWYHSSSDLFGCVGLKKKQYCILNKQYSKEEYEKLIPQLKKHMTNMPYVDKMGRIYAYGEFFPSEMSPFPYNVSEAHEFFPKTKAEAQAENLMWKEEEKRSYNITLKSDDLTDNINDTKDNILNETIECEHAGNCSDECTSAFKIISQELQFLKRLGIPLPRLCPNCRHYERLTHRNLPEFYQRQCQCEGKTGKTYQNTATHFHSEDKCPNEFETSYAPDRPEIVYCEQCYQSEVA